jgi:hypothetical protein
MANPSELRIFYLSKDTANERGSQAQKPKNEKAQKPKEKSAKD